MAFARASLLFLAATLAASSLFACGSGYSDEKAETICNEERRAKGDLFNDATYKACFDCHVECGDECEPRSTTPLSYVCPEE